MTLIDRYGEDIFSRIRRCSICDCETIRNCDLPHEYALIGKNYEEARVKILFIGKATNSDPTTLQERESRIIPQEYISYQEFLIAERTRFTEYTPLYHADHYCTISSIISHLSERSPSIQSLDDVCFTNLGHCYNTNGWEDKNQVNTLLNNCREKLLWEMQLLRPHIVIGLGGAVKERFPRLDREEVGHLLTIGWDDERNFAEFRFTEENPDVRRLFISFYHPAYLSGHGRSQRNSYHPVFIEKIDLIANYLDIMLFREA